MHDVLLIFFFIYTYTLLYLYASVTEYRSTYAGMVFDTLTSSSFDKSNVKSQIFNISLNVDNLERVLNMVTINILFVCQLTALHIFNYFPRHNSWLCMKFSFSGSFFTYISFSFWGENIFKRYER